MNESLVMLHKYFKYLLPKLFYEFINILFFMRVNILIKFFIILNNFK
jgi:hypothetical protein